MFFGNVERPPRLSEFDLEVPEKCIGQHPAKKRDECKLMILVFLLRELDTDLWEAMVKPARKVRIGNKLFFNDKIGCDVIDNTVSGGRVLRFEFKENESLYPFIDKYGNAPLPPYIKRPSKDSDKKDYQ